MGPVAPNRGLKKQMRKGGQGRAEPRASDARAPHALGRDARRLLSAMAQEGASPARGDLRDKFLVVAAPRNGVSSIIANIPDAGGEELVARGLARWTAGGGRRVLALSPEGAAMARRLAAPDGADAFRVQHAELVVRAPAPGETPVTVDAAESPLTWLARRKGRDGAPYLDPAQVEAGERFRRDVEIAQLRPRVTSDWSGLPSSGGRGGQGMQVSDLAIAARQRLDRAAGAVGRELEGVLVDVCGFQKGLELVERERSWPPRSAKVVLRIALDRLAAHYGLASVARGPDGSRARRWGAIDYRPTIDGPA